MATSAIYQQWAASLTRCHSASAAGPGPSYTHTHAHAHEGGGITAVSTAGATALDPREAVANTRSSTATVEHADARRHSAALAEEHAHTHSRTHAVTHKSAHLNALLSTCPAPEADDDDAAAPVSIDVDDASSVRSAPRPTGLQACVAGWLRELPHLAAHKENRAYAYSLIAELLQCNRLREAPAVTHAFACVVEALTASVAVTRAMETFAGATAPAGTDQRTREHEAVRAFESGALGTLAGCLSAISDNDAGLRANVDSDTRVRMGNCILRMLTAYTRSALPTATPSVLRVPALLLADGHHLRALLLLALKAFIVDASEVSVEHETHAAADDSMAGEVSDQRLFARRAYVFAEKDIDAMEPLVRAAAVEVVLQVASAMPRLRARLEARLLKTLQQWCHSHLDAGAASVVWNDDEYLAFDTLLVACVHLALGHQRTPPRDQDHKSHDDDSAARSLDHSGHGSYLRRLVDILGSALALDTDARRRAGPTRLRAMQQKFTRMGKRFRPFLKFTATKGGVPEGRGAVAETHAAGGAEPTAAHDEAVRSRLVGALCSCLAQEMALLTAASPLTGGGASDADAVFESSATRTILYAMARQLQHARDAARECATAVLATTRGSSLQSETNPAQDQRAYAQAQAALRAASSDGGAPPVDQDVLASVSQAFGHVVDIVTLLRAIAVSCGQERVLRQVVDVLLDAFGQDRDWCASSQVAALLRDALDASDAAARAASRKMAATSSPASGSIFGRWFGRSAKTANLATPTLLGPLAPIPEPTSIEDRLRMEVAAIVSGTLHALLDSVAALASTTQSNELYLAVADTLIVNASIAGDGAKSGLVLLLQRSAAPAALVRLAQGLHDGAPAGGGPLSADFAAAERSSRAMELLLRLLRSIGATPSEALTLAPHQRAVAAAVAWFCKALALSATTALRSSTSTVMHGAVRSGTAPRTSYAGHVLSSPVQTVRDQILLRPRVLALHAVDTGHAGSKAAMLPDAWTPTYAIPAGLDVGTLRAFRAGWAQLIISGATDVAASRWLPGAHASLRKLALHTPVLLAAVTPLETDTSCGITCSDAITADLRGFLSRLLPDAREALASCSAQQITTARAICGAELMRALAGTCVSVLTYWERLPERDAFGGVLGAVMDTVVRTWMLAVSRRPPSQARDAALHDHCMYFLAHITSRYLRVRTAACRYLVELCDRFPHILWSKECLEGLLRLMQDQYELLANSTTVAPPSKVLWRSICVEASTSVAELADVLVDLVHLSSHWLLRAALCAPSITRSFLCGYVSRTADLVADIAEGGSRMAALAAALSAASGASTADLVVRPHGMAARLRAAATAVLGRPSPLGLASSLSMLSAGSVYTRWAGVGFTASAAGADTAAGAAAAPATSGQAGFLVPGGVPFAHASSTQLSGLGGFFATAWARDSLVRDPTDSALSQQTVLAPRPLRSVVPTDLDDDAVSLVLVNDAASIGTARSRRSAGVPSVTPAAASLGIRDASGSAVEPTLLAVTTGPSAGAGAGALALAAHFLGTGTEYALRPEPDPLVALANTLTPALASAQDRRAFYTGLVAGMLHGMNRARYSAGDAAALRASGDGCEALAADLVEEGMHLLQVTQRKWRDAALGTALSAPTSAASEEAAVQWAVDCISDVLGLLPPAAVPAMAHELSGRRKHGRGMRWKRALGDAGVVYGPDTSSEDEARAVPDSAGATRGQHAEGAEARAPRATHRRTSAAARNLRTPGHAEHTAPMMYTAAALLVWLHNECDDGHADDIVHALMFVLVWLPFRLFDGPTMRVAVECWAWAMDNHTLLRERVLSAVRDAWIWSIEMRIGLFSSDAADTWGHTKRASSERSRGQLPRPVGVAALTSSSQPPPPDLFQPIPDPGSRGAATNGLPAQPQGVLPPALCAIEPHDVVLQFMQQRFWAARTGSPLELSALTSMVSAATGDASLLSTAAHSFGPRVRLVHLGLCMLHAARPELLRQHVLTARAPSDSDGTSVGTSGDTGTQRQPLSVSMDSRNVGVALGNAGAAVGGSTGADDVLADYWSWAGVGDGEDGHLMSAGGISVDAFGIRFEDDLASAYTPMQPGAPVGGPPLTCSSPDTWLTEALGSPGLFRERILRAALSWFELPLQYQEISTSSATVRRDFATLIAVCQMLSNDALLDAPLPALSRSASAGLHVGSRSPQVPSTGLSVGASTPTAAVQPAGRGVSFGGKRGRGGQRELYRLVVGRLGHPALPAPAMRGRGMLGPSGSSSSPLPGLVSDSTGTGLASYALTLSGTRRSSMTRAFDVVAAHERASQKPHWSASAAQAQADGPAWLAAAGNVPTEALGSSNHVSPAPAAVQNFRAGRWVAAHEHMRSMRQLLLLLLGQEIDRIVAWHNPNDIEERRLPHQRLFSFDAYVARMSDGSTPGVPNLSQAEWTRWVDAAWSVSPLLAMRMLRRFHWHPDVRQALQRLVASDPLALRGYGDAVPLLVTPEAIAAGSPQLRHLLLWKPAAFPVVLSLLSRCAHNDPVGRPRAAPASGHPYVAAYVVRCLRRFSPDLVAFLLPQLVQALRHDSSGQVADFLFATSQTSMLVAHQLVWVLVSESKSSDEDSHKHVTATNASDKETPIVSNLVVGPTSSDNATVTGTDTTVATPMESRTEHAGADSQPPGFYGFQRQLKGIDPLPIKAAALIHRIISTFPPTARALFELQYAFWDSITNISGRLKLEVADPAQRRSKIKEFLRDLKHAAERDASAAASAAYRKLRDQLRSITDAEKRASGSMPGSMETRVDSAPAGPSIDVTAGTEKPAPVVLSDSRPVLASPAAGSAPVDRVHALAGALGVLGGRLPQDMQPSSVPGEADAPGAAQTHAVNVSAADGMPGARDRPQAGGAAAAPSAMFVPSLVDVVYMPTAPHLRVVKVEMESGRPMQSAAKCPFMLSFQVVPYAGPDATLRRQERREERVRREQARLASHARSAALSKVLKLRKRESTVKRAKQAAQHAASVMRKQMHRGRVQMGLNIERTRKSVARELQQGSRKVAQGMDRVMQGVRGVGKAMMTAIPPAPKTGSGSKDAPGGTVDAAISASHAVSPSVLSSAEPGLASALERERDGAHSPWSGSDASVDLADVELDAYADADNARLDASSNDSDTSDVENARGAAPAMPLQVPRRNAEAPAAQRAAEIAPEGGESSGLDAAKSRRRGGFTPFLSSRRLRQRGVSGPAKHVPTVKADTEGSKPDRTSTLLRTACIFKVFDDCRQDAVVMQVVQLLKAAFENASLGLHLYPYKVLPTRTGSKRVPGGILEVVPDVRSRDEIGKAGFPNLFDYFLASYGRQDSIAFDAARRAFIESLAAYSVVCYVMRIKDRHNGNLLVAADGSVIHIDFGFILGISPGGNLGFETAAFKLTQEMLNIMGGSVESEGFMYFSELVNRGFMLARDNLDAIHSLVAAMSDSGLPCYLFADTLQKLWGRCVPEESDLRACRFMRNESLQAANRMTTILYDGIQKLQNNIHSETWQ